MIDDYEPDIEVCPKCGRYADNGFDRCVPPSPYVCSKCEAEEKWMYIVFSDATYRVSFKKLAEMYAERNGDREDYEQIYEIIIRDEKKIIHWADYHLEWVDVKEHAELFDKITDYDKEWVAAEKYVAG